MLRQSETVTVTSTAVHLCLSKYALKLKSFGCAISWLVSDFVLRIIHEDIDVCVA